MSFLSQLGNLFLGGVVSAEVRTRAAASEFPSYEEQLAAIQNRSRYIWRAASVDEALGVPSVFDAVSLISNTVGSLSMRAYRNGALLDQLSTPRIVQRPNPFSSPRVFWRDTAYFLATRGEAWWWIAARDPIDGKPLSVYPVPPWEVTLEANDRDRLRPTIKWADRTIRNEDIRQLTYLPGQNGRGMGPLQKCGAAVSIAVEAQEWAANFFSGSVPSIIGETDQDMTEAELELMDAQWLEKPPNLPRWVTNGLKIRDMQVNPQTAQLTESRREDVGNTARMFSMPGELLEYHAGGSSLTYKNEEGIWTDFARRCLSPHYLEPMEQEMSDLLTRSTVGRFDLKQLLRADAKTRMEVHGMAIDKGIYGPEVAAQEEGYLAGSPDFAPVPLSPPQAVPSLLPPNRQLTAARSAMVDLHCPKCGKLAGRVSGPAEIVCPRCKTLAAA